MKRIFLFGFGLVLALHAAQPPPEWRGYCELPDGALFSLTPSAGGRAEWAKVGETRLGFRLVSGAKDQLVLADAVTGEQHKLRLMPAKVVRGQAEIPPLPKAEALAWVRQHLRQRGTSELKLLAPEELSLDEKQKIAALNAEGEGRAKDLVRTLDANAKSPAPLPVTEVIDAVAALSGAVQVESRIENGVRHTNTFYKMVLAELPPYVRANLTQADLDALMPEQMEAARRLFEKYRAIK